MSLSRWLHALPALLWASLIFWLSSRPAGLEPPPWFLSNDKILHAAVFGILAALLFHMFRAAAGLRPARAALYAIVIASFYGIADEWHQSFVPTRDVDPADWAADTIGAVLFVLPILAYHARRKRT